MAEQQQFDLLRGKLWFGDTKQFFILGLRLVNMIEDDAMRSDSGEKRNSHTTLEKPFVKKNLLCAPRCKGYG